MTVKFYSLQELAGVKSRLRRGILTIALDQKIEALTGDFKISQTPAVRVIAAKP
jgi:hypothetical protein